MNGELSISPGYAKTFKPLEQWDPEVDAWKEYYAAQYQDCLRQCQASLGEDIALEVVRHPQAYVIYDIADPTARKELGQITYTHKKVSRHLYVSSVSVDPSVRKHGISQLLLNRVLLDHPDSESIEGELTETNELVLDAKEAEGMSREEALRFTPAYKISESLGFTGDIDMKANIFTIQRQADAKTLDQAA